MSEFDAKEVKNEVVQETKSRSSLEFMQNRLTKVLCLMPEFLIFQRKK